MGVNHPQTLLLAGRFAPVAERAWADQLDGLPSAPRALLTLSFDDPDDVVDRWRARLRAPPETFGILGVEEFTRTAVGAGGPQAAAPGPVSIRTVSDPGNLTDLGIQLTEFLDDAARQYSPGEVLVAVENVSTLLQYTDLERTYRFVHVLTNCVRGHGVPVLCHMDPAAHDDQTVATFTGLFDRRVTVEDGELCVSDRPRPGGEATAEQPGDAAPQSDATVPR